MHLQLFIKAAVRREADVGDDAVERVLAFLRSGEENSQGAVLALANLLNRLDDISRPISNAALVVCRQCICFASQSFSFWQPVAGNQFNRAACCRGSFAASNPGNPRSLRGATM